MTKRTNSTGIGISAFLIASLLVAIVALLIVKFTENDSPVESEIYTSVEGERGDRETTNKGRAEYFFNLMRDPATNSIPASIRLKELEFANRIDSEVQQKGMAKTANLQWTAIGPDDVSGRTRALAADSRDPNILIAGGASGGMWKSTDGGLTWAMKSTQDHNPSVTSVAQDPTNPDTWYFSTGEYRGSTPDKGGVAFYYGSGLYISTDNGESWAQVASTKDDDVSFNSKYDYVHRVVVSPVTGTVLFASNAVGISRSTNGLSSSTTTLGVLGGAQYSDVAFTEDGNAIATASSEGFGQSFQDGVFYSDDDGLTWDNITPASFPADHFRSEIGVSKSNPDIFYVLTDSNGDADGMMLHYFDVSNYPTVVSENRTANIPDFEGEVGSLEPQSSYNLVCKVHPDNSDLVFIGGTNLYRSTDGFSSSVDQGNADKYWIGGYAVVNNISQYKNHHPDQHNLIFPDPSNPDHAYSSHDGGISFTTDITAEPVVWTTREHGYNVTQFYHVALHPDAGDTKILGGTQDNGSPFFSFNVNGSPTASSDVSSGDGAYAYLGQTYAVASSQNGFLIRYLYNSTGNLTAWSYLLPSGASNQLFIHPFAVNPSNEDILFYPDGDVMWRNIQTSTLDRNTTDDEGITQGWTKLTNISSNGGGNITALSFSTSNPSNVLYYAASSGNGVPKVFRLDDPNASDGEVDISIPGTGGGEYILELAVNPEDGNEVLAIVSNYGVQSVYHTTNAGTSWSGVGGNLEGTNGPSVRAAIIGDNNGSPVYMVGTSTGVYYTENLSGAGTIWTKQAQELIGNTIVEHMAYRPSDGAVAIATHGRGIVYGKIPESTPIEDELSDSPLAFSLEQNYPNPFNPSTNISFNLPSASRVTLTVYDINGREVARLLNNESLTAGDHSQLFDAVDLASGTYMYRVEAIPNTGSNIFIDSKMMTLIK